MLGKSGAQSIRDLGRRVDHGDARTLQRVAFTGVAATRRATMAPAWPIFLPGGEARPAMKATTGFVMRAA